MKGEQNSLQPSPTKKHGERDGDIFRCVPKGEIREGSQAEGMVYIGGGATVNTCYQGKREPVYVAQTASKFDLASETGISKPLGPSSSSRLFFPPLPPRISFVFPSFF